MKLLPILFFSPLIAACVPSYQDPCLIRPPCKTFPINECICEPSNDRSTLFDSPVIDNDNKDITDTDNGGDNSSNDNVDDDSNVDDRSNDRNDDDRSNDSNGDRSNDRSNDSNDDNGSSDDNNDD